MTSPPPSRILLILTLLSLQDVTIDAFGLGRSLPSGSPLLQYDSWASESLSLAGSAGNKRKMTSSHPLYDRISSSSKKRWSYESRGYYSYSQSLAPRILPSGSISRSRLDAASSNTNEEDANPSPRKEVGEEIIQSWLLNYLPTLAPSDLERYTQALEADGFASLDALNSIRDDEEEDLEFMKRGHRRVLLKKLAEGSTVKSNSSDSKQGDEGESNEDIIKSTNNEDTLQIETMDMNTKTQNEQEVRGNEEEGARLKDSAQQQQQQQQRLQELQELERQLNERRAERIAEEERLEHLLADAKSRAASSSLTEEECELLLEDEEEEIPEECWDITQNANFEERTSRSLATTLPPKNSRRSLANVNVNANNAKRRTAAAAVSSPTGEDLEEERYFDITQNIFPENIRRGSPLRRRLAKEKSEAAAASSILADEKSESAAKASAEAEEGAMLEEYYDITQNSFPERETAFQPEDRSEMNRRGTANKASGTTTTAASALYQKIKRQSKKDAKGDQTAAHGQAAYYDITQSSFPDLQSSFRKSEKSEMNRRAPPSQLGGGRASPRWATGTLTNATPSIKVDDEQDDMDSTKQDFKGDAADDPSMYLDITSLFPEDRRPSALVNTGTPQRMKSEIRRYDDNFRSLSTPKTFHKNEEEEEEEGVDITRQHFPTNQRPSAFVNTGTKKERTQTGTKKERTTYAKNSNNNKGTKADEAEEEFVDITRHHFPEDRGSFILRVNSGTKKRGTTSGSGYEETSFGSRNVAQNFSRDHESLVGHPSRRKSPTRVPKSKSSTTSNDSISGNGTANRSNNSAKGGNGQDDKYLDKNTFSSPKDLSPPSKVHAAATSVVWRSSDSSGTKHEKFLDTPPAFAKHIEMTPPSKSKSGYRENAGGPVTNNGKEARVPRQSLSTANLDNDDSEPKRKKKVTEADKYLDTNTFSWNLSPSAGVNKKLSQRAKSASAATTTTTATKTTAPPKGGFGTQQQQEEEMFLDTPRPFRSNVDMVSSNMSGAKFKRSSDMPPEVKRDRSSRDYFDITTAPMPSIDDMADTKISRTVTPSGRSSSSTSKSREEEEDGDYFDITRMSTKSRLERATSAVKDANTAWSRTEVQKSSSSESMSNSNEDDSSDGEESSYEAVMHWLLTHLPQLQEEDAITYFHHLLEDGFDSIDMLGGDVLEEEDLHFMKRGHQRALLRSIRGAEDEVEEQMVGQSLANDDGNDEEQEENVASSLEMATLDETIDRARAELEKTEAWIEEQNRLVEEKLISGLVDEDEEGTKMDMAAEVAEEDDGEEFKDITRSSFVDRPSIALTTSRQPRDVAKSPKQMVHDDDGIEEEEKEVYDITRDAFPEDRPSLEIDALGHEKRRKQSKHNDSDESEDKENEEVYDITRDAFPEDRPSSAIVAHPRQTSSPDGSKETKESSLCNENDPNADNATTHGAAPDTAPRAELYQYYIKKGLSSAQAQELKDYYTTWTNDAKSHELKFTSVFTCPLTGERFACGSWNMIDVEGDSGDESQKIFWYKNKKQAMNAAAAKALDCFYLRECHGKDMMPQQRCPDSPYLSKEEAPALPTPPTGINFPTTVIQPDSLSQDT